MANLVGQSTTATFTGTTGQYGAEANVCFYDIFTASASGNATALFLYINSFGTQSAIKLAIWDASGTLLAATAAITTGDPGWVSAAITSTAITESSNYYLGFINSNSGYITPYHDTTPWETGGEVNSYTTPTNLTSPDAQSKALNQFAIYADGSAGGGGGSTLIKKLAAYRRMRLG